MHYSNAYSDVTYNEVLVSACAENGIAAFTGDSGQQCHGSGDAGYQSC